MSSFFLSCLVLFCSLLRKCSLCMVFVVVFYVLLFNCLIINWWWVLNIFFICLIKFFSCVLFFVCLILFSFLCSFNCFIRNVVLCIVCCLLVRLKLCKESKYFVCINGWCSVCQVWLMVVDCCMVVSCFVWFLLVNLLGWYWCCRFWKCRFSVWVLSW